MKNKITILILVIFFNGCSSSSKYISNNKDLIPNYKMMLSGKFIQEIKEPKASSGYYMVIKDSLRIEYSENGKYYTKSKIKFIKPDYFTSIAYESTIPGFRGTVKELVETVVLETSTTDSLIKIKERTPNSKWKIFLLKKVQE